MNGKDFSVNLAIKI